MDSLGAVESRICRRDRFCSGLWWRVCCRSRCSMRPSWWSSGRSRLHRWRAPIWTTIRWCWSKHLVKLAVSTSSLYVIQVSPYLSVYSFYRKSNLWTCQESIVQLTQRDSQDLWVHRFHPKLPARSYSELCQLTQFRLMQLSCSVISRPSWIRLDERLAN